MKTYNLTYQAHFAVDPYEYVDNQANDNGLKINLIWQGWGQPFAQEIVRWEP